MPYATDDIPLPETPLAYGPSWNNVFRNQTVICNLTMNFLLCF
jgi:hypothetical protein